MLLLFPMLVAWMKLLAHHFRRKSESTCRELLTNLFLVLCASPVVIFQVRDGLIRFTLQIKIEPKKGSPQKVGFGVPVNNQPRKVYEEIRRLPRVFCQVGLFLICLLDLLQVRPKSLGALCSR